MEVTKEIFFEFLKKNNFYEGWNEGYNLDNEIWGDVIPLDAFFTSNKPHIWLYNGPSAMAAYYNLPNGYINLTEDYKKRYDEWRHKYMETYMDLDEKWMNLVDNILSKQKIR